jgi:hypothetical protein
MDVVVAPTAFYVAMALQRTHNALVSGAIGAAALIGVGLQGVAQFSQRDGYSSEEGHSRILEYLGTAGGKNLVRYVPSSFTDNQTRLFVYWTLGVGLVTLVVWLFRSRVPDPDIAEATPSHTIPEANRGSDHRPEIQ